MKLAFEEFFILKFYTCMKFSLHILQSLLLAYMRSVLTL